MESSVPAPSDLLGKIKGQKVIFLLIFSCEYEDKWEKGFFLFSGGNMKVTLFKYKVRLY